MAEPNRIEPQLPAAAMKTYQITQPVQTHFRKASCAEVDCPNLANGWRSIIDERSDLGQGQAWYIRNQSGRSFIEYTDATGFTVFEFEPGQRCFGEHQVSLERPANYLVRGGDWRGNPAGVLARIHSTADSWVEDFAEHQQTLADRLNQG